ncbi:MAG: hypothetical protein AB7N24_21885 [Dehalococcoidia bacterium]
MSANTSDHSGALQPFTADFADGEVASRRRNGLARFSRTEWLLVAAFFGAWAAYLAWAFLF